MMERGPDQGCFPDPANTLFIAENPEIEEAARWEFKRVGLNLNYVGGSQ